ncbi:MAG: tRNA (guanosine(37)-N1)-methyltransferase TrmD [Clostridiales bacterium]|jgi:tRNA (guanine37-N1)-methyltransferase|nr:tRNA (guanosine(37)-N1)-methyltransferase TrmD [Clostridiales bacterium]
MRIDILTLFPEMVSGLCHSVVGRGIEAGALDIRAVNIRDYTADKHGRCDDYTFGGGDGMLMAPQPICDCIEAVDPNHDARRIYMSPCGRLLDQRKARELAALDRLVILCGHYEGADRRAIDLCIDEEISIGDYILTGGELPALALADCVARLVPGVLGNAGSLSCESFEGNLLEYPQYTRPQNFRGIEVPETLLSGNHARIAEWRHERRVELTRKNRPDLYRKYLRGKKKETETLKN